MTVCAAFGCNRFTRRFKSEHAVYLCPAHWPQVPKRLRRLFNKACRIADRAEDPTEKEIERCWRLWHKCVAAVHRNVGMP